MRPQALDTLVAGHSCNGHFNNLPSSIQEARFLTRTLFDAALGHQSLEARQKRLYCNEHHHSKGNTADERRRSISPAFIGYRYRLKYQSALPILLLSMAVLELLAKGLSWWLTLLAMDCCRETLRPILLSMTVKNYYPTLHCILMVARLIFPFWDVLVWVNQRSNR